MRIRAVCVCVCLSHRLEPSLTPPPSALDGDDIVFHNFVDICVAVATDKGLVVPVLRDCDKRSFADIEKMINDFGVKARNKSITKDEMTGGTFTISNGGVFGSLMGTPILNPPQSAILGMHNIVPRPVAVNNQVVIRTYSPRIETVK